MCTMSRYQIIKYINYKKELKLHHKEVRKHGLEHLKVLRNEKGQEKEAKIIQKIANLEMNRANWSIVKNTLRPRVKSGTCIVEVPNLNVNGLPITNR